MSDELTRLVHGCLLPTIGGPQVPAELRPLLGDGLGGVILFARSIRSRAQLAGLTTSLRADAPDLLIATDEEGGDVTRLEAATGSSYPGNRALGHVDDTALTAQVAAAIGADLATTGVNLGLAPVADVQSDPRSPVIGVRSFGSEPALVARHTAAYVTGMQSTGVAACAKHLPGHGATELDSHRELPVVPADRALLDARDLPPFRAAIDAGVLTVMSAHVVYPELDDQPATLSYRILTDLVRRDLGFTGVVITDALGMAAISGTVGVEVGAVQALAAGADLLCLDLDAAGTLAVRDAVLSAVHTGQLSADRVAEAAGRVRALQQLARPDPKALRDSQIGLLAARRALLVDCPVPLPAAPHVIDAGGRPVTGIAGTSAGLLDILQARDPATTGSVVRPPADVSALLAEAVGRPLVLAVREAHRQPDQRAVLDTVRAARPDALVVGCGTADDARLAPGHYLGTLGRARVNLLAAAEVLLPQGVSS